MPHSSADDPAKPGGPFLLRSPVWRWLAAVAAGLVLGLTILRLGLLPDTGAIPVGWLATAAAAISAAVLAWVQGLTPVWRIAAATAPVIAALVLVYSPPLWVLPVLLVAASGVFWNVRRERVPLYLSNRQTLEAVAQLTRDLPAGAVVDLGCGLAGSVVALAKRLPDRTVVGVENAPLLYAAAWLRVTLFGPANARVRYGSLWAEPLAPYRLVYCFLSSEPMERLVRKAKDEIKTGGILVSNTFTDPLNTAEEVVLVGDSRETHLNVWRI